MKEQEHLKRSNENITYLQPVVKEKRIWNLNNFFIAFGLGCFIIILDYVFIAFFDLELIISILIATISSIFYAAMLFFLLEPALLKEVSHGSIRTVERRVPYEKPVVERVFIENPQVREIPVEKIIKVPVEKEVIRRIFVPEPVPYKVETKRKMPTPVHYKYVGSKTTKTYQSTKSRLARLIKKKNRVYSNSRIELEKMGYKPAVKIIRKDEKETKKKIKKINKELDKGKNRKAIKKKTTKKSSK